MEYASGLIKLKAASEKKVEDEQHDNLEAR
jgi:hypothetical protein